MSATPIYDELSRTLPLPRREERPTEEVQALRTLLDELSSLGTRHGRRPANPRGRVVPHPRG